MEFLVYLLKSSLLLFLFWVIYKSLLERETFHFIKRIYLISGLIISAFLPLIHHTTYENLLVNQQTHVAISDQFKEHIITLSWWEKTTEFVLQHHLIEIIYFSVSAIILSYFIFSFFKLLKSLRTSAKVKEGGINYIKTSKNEAFSFLNYIVYNPELHTEKEINFILNHERAHVNNRHSIDTIIAIIYKSIFWINPMAWFYKKEIAQNLEFEADAEATTKRNSQAYQYSLFKMTSQNYVLQQSFKQSSLKKRIMMLNTINSKKSIWKIFMVTPFLFVYFMFFQTETKAQIVESTKVEADMDSETKVEIKRVSSTYDENSTLENLKKDIAFIKDSFDIDLSYSRLKEKNGLITAMKLKFKKNGTSSSAYSNDLEENPIYFYYDKTKRENPIGVGIGKIEEQNEAKKSALTIEKMDEAEYITINSKKYNYNKLLKKTVSVKELDYNDETKTIHITSDPKLSQAIYDKDTKDLFKTIEKELGSNLIKDKKFLIISEKSKPMLFTINKLTVSSYDENSSESNVDDVNFNSIDPIYLLDGKEVKKEEFTSIAPEEVMKVNVVKNKDKIKKLGYNPDEVPGVIEITTKE